ncbi:hypothetical protein LINGRAHAP2_LOCUS35275 [Linum grandiflorum]
MKCGCRGCTAQLWWCGRGGLLFKPWLLLYYESGDKRNCGRYGKCVGRWIHILAI